MKHQVLFCLSLISFLSYSSEYSRQVADDYAVHEMYWLRGRGHNPSAPEYNEVQANFRVIGDIPMNKKDRNECRAIMERASQDNKSFEGLVEWSKSYDDSGKMRKVHRS